jgi:NADH dehydrogenase
MIFGRGDHMLDHLTRALCTVPVFASVGHRRVRPLAVGDVVNVLQATLVDGRLRLKTVPLIGPTEIEFDDAVRIVGKALGKHVRLLRLPFSFLYAAGWLAEGLMTVPLISQAQVRILSEEVIAPVLALDSLPTDLVPSTPFNVQTIKGEMPDCAPFRLADFRWFASRPQSAHGRR